MLWTNIEVEVVTEFPVRRRILILILVGVEGEGVLGLSGLGNRKCQLF